MSPLWMALSLVYPLTGAVLCALPRVPGLVVRFFLASLALPTLAVALAMPEGVPQSTGWLLFGAPLALAGPARLFLLFTAALWTLAGLASGPYTATDPHRRRYALFFLCSFTGNAGLFLSTDLPQFYTFFALMTFSAYGLVVHNRSPEAVRAGQLYIGMAVLGELLLLSGMLLLAWEAQSLVLSQAPAVIAASEHRTLIMGLLILGFGVKAGLLPLHIWLPLAHPVAPTPASAVLSGAMIKAGLFGWLLLLPGGQLSMPLMGQTLMGFGLVAAFAAALAGLTQNHAKASLAYSSISQMGLMTLALGLGLADASVWNTSVAVISFYALNHAMAKGSLFLAVAAAHDAANACARRAVMIGAALAALVLVGAPGTGGELSKAALKALGASHTWIGPVLSLSALTTTLLLVRYLVLLRRDMPEAGHHAHHGSGRGFRFFWLASVAVCLLLPGAAASGLTAAAFPQVGTFKIPAAWPILLGALLGYALLRRPHIRPAVPMGDLALPLLRGCTRLASTWLEVIAPWMDRHRVHPDPLIRLVVPEKEDARTWLDREPENMRRLSRAGLVLLTLLMLFWWGTAA